uniref:Uncharacterized protein n=1 Tax=uncultured prokaryote TaxID=198431 RepID=A0A0H5QKA1_9ZZZZ|nr:hypothetical protein [uncultured prokaryote]
MTMDRAERAERASATLLRVSVVQTMVRDRVVRVTWKGRNDQYAFPTLLRKDVLIQLERVPERQAAVMAAIFVLEETLVQMIDGQI